MSGRKIKSSLALLYERRAINDKSEGRDAETSSA
jgi:hypothetical protein